ncbi:thiamine pyrophosphate-binding protein [Corallococcus macrosporus]|uniref:Thiamine pyrophosphate-binding protein n=1 Tax=Corallococcus macrosporus TaxID=35 RepID=A0ABS3DJN3_9BACT|nr:thiamine pyrophosphate-binding protein [Corallococcus macrosporus]MBN8231521.1 thiamine pyrophosphate-binding protein [Corallococcus macrosporus]
MKKRTGCVALLEQLAAEGTRYLFGNPGTVEEGFLDALRDVPSIQYILGLHESVAVAMADGHARATRRPAFVQLHSSVGLGNGIGMLYQAKRGNTPLVVLAGEAGLAYDAMDAQMAGDLVSMARPVTKWATRVVDAGSVLRVLRRAIKIASTPPMGPVFVSLPMDVLDAPNDEPVFPTPRLDTRSAPEPEAVKALARLLAEARHPLLIVGDGVAASGAQEELTRVAELLGAEVWGANSSEVNMDAAHPLFRGLLGHMFGKDSAAVVSRADAVLITGTYVFPEVFPALSGVFRPGARVAHVDLDAYEIAKNFPVDLGLVADPKRTLAALAEALTWVMTPARREAAAERLRRAREQQELERARASAGTAPGETREAPPALFLRELAKRVGDEAIIFDEALTLSPEVARALPGRRPGHSFQTRGGSLGVGIPGALGVKLAHPDKTVIGFTGDGGSMYTIQALWTAARHGIGAKFVVCNNGGYRLLDLNLLQYWKERGIPEHPFPGSFDLSRPALHFVELARSLGVPAVRVSTEQDIGPALDLALSASGPFLIDWVLPHTPLDPGADRRCGQ